MKNKLLSFLCLSFIIIAIYSFPTLVKPAMNKLRKETIVVIDVGHGGYDSGKVSADGLYEKDINLKIANYLRDYLIAQDMTVYLTRETDRGLYDENASNKKRSDMNNRIAFFAEKSADYVISIHQNSFPSSKEHGAQVFYYYNSKPSQEMATHIQDALLKCDPTNKRQAKENDSYYILKHSKVPSVIVECGFLSNPQEAANLNDENWQKKIAYAICIGFLKSI